MNHFIVVEPDEFAENPREAFDCVGTLYTWHSKYTLGGQTDENHQEPIKNLNVWIFDHFEDVAWMPELKDYVSHNNELYFEDMEIDEEQIAHFNQIVEEWKQNNLCVIPVYMYDHSEITISDKPFSCPWDSGQIGFIYMTKDTFETQMQRPYSVKEAEKILVAKLKELDTYLTGDVYSYSIYSTEETCDVTEIYESTYHVKEFECITSCGGFYGYQYCKESALAELNAIQQKVDV